jgi:uroporphyrinogen III methyltransferase / synthase
VEGGIVYLVGAGPGDPGLMTRRSLELIAAADAILYDRLIPAGALDGARPDAELRYVGKEPGNPAVAQEEINELLVSLGRAGKRVLRLKGGDPFVFGRGGE